MVKQFRRYVYSFWHDPQTWQTGRQTDRHRMMAIAALMHSIARQKLTVASNAGGVWKTRDHCWMVTCDHNWMAYYSLSHVSWWPWRPCRCYKQYPMTSGTGMHQWTIFYDASHQSCIEDKLSKKPFWPPIWETPKDTATKCRETHVWDRALPSCKFC